MRNDASQICRACHPAYAKGPELGTHPVGGMPWPVPDELVAAGARVGPDQHRLICQTCHTPHGAREDHLLVMGTRSSELCLTCHKKLRPGLWRPEAVWEHPQNPPLSTDAQRRAIRELGTRVGSGEALICLSCHKLHHGQAGRNMLAETLADSRLCLKCHAERGRMLGTAHDLRTSAPEERNRLGQTAETSGPCGACHTFHQFARRPYPQPVEPTGLCATCHREGQCAEKATGLPLEHPREASEEDLPAPDMLPLLSRDDGGAGRTIICLTCHDPHQDRRPHFLREQPDTLCSTCHAEQGNLLAGGHDFSNHPEFKNGRGANAAQAGKCGFCHGVHDADGPALWVATESRPDGPDDLCRQCHQPGNLASGKPFPELRHPAGPETAASHEARESQLPLFAEDGQRATDGLIACATCHDPHGGESARSRSLLRGRGGPAPRTLCLQCHQEMRSISLSLHNEQVMREHFDAVIPCAPCHAAHAKPGMSPAGMWAAPKGANTYPPDVQRCMGCHGPEGNAIHITPVGHPAVALGSVNLPDTPGFLPLVNEAGGIDPDGSIGCITCHLPHGRSPGGGMPALEPGQITPARRRAMKSMVRPYIAPNLCSACHGLDGLRRFLYFHDPHKRGESHE